MDETGLIEAAQRGDLDAFNRLVLAFQDLVYAQAYRMMGEHAAADDATQEAFISAYRSLSSFRGGSFKAWLLRIVTNACYDELRRRKRRPTAPLEPFNDYGEEIESPSWLEDPGESPEDAAERADLSRNLLGCLQELPEEFRAVVALVDMQGFDYAETAQAMGVPLGTVKSRLARARLRLRDCLQNIGELLPAEYRLENDGS